MIDMVILDDVGLSDDATRCGVRLAPAGLSSINQLIMRAGASASH
jgi:hypothetical protein